MTWTSLWIIFVAACFLAVLIEMVCPYPAPCDYLAMIVDWFFGGDWWDL